LAFSSKILEFNYQNVFFTLFIGLLTMIAYRAVEEKEEWNQALKVILYILIVAAGMALAYLIIEFEYFAAECQIKRYL